MIMVRRTLSAVLVACVVAALAGCHRSRSHHYVPPPPSYSILGPGETAQFILDVDAGTCYLIEVRARDIPKGSELNPVLTIRDLNGDILFQVDDTLYVKREHQRGRDRHAAGLEWDACVPGDVVSDPLPGDEIYSFTFLIGTEDPMVIFTPSVDQTVVVEIDHFDNLVYGANEGGAGYRYTLDVFEGVCFGDLIGELPLVTLITPDGEEYFVDEFLSAPTTQVAGVGSFTELLADFFSGELTVDEILALFPLGEYTILVEYGGGLVDLFTIDVAQDFFPSYPELVDPVPVAGVADICDRWDAPWIDWLEPDGADFVDGELYLGGTDLFIEDFEVAGTDLGYDFLSALSPGEEYDLILYNVAEAVTTDDYGTSTFVDFVSCSFYILSTLDCP